MKRLISTFCTCVILLSGMTSCKKFFTVEPTNKFSSDTYFNSESEMELFANGFVNSWLPTYGEGLAGGGNMENDLIATKAGSDYLHTPNIWGPSKQGGWATGDFNWARRTNFMIEGIEKNGGAVDAEIRNHYLGIARFWRAARCWTRVKTFSNAKWIDHYIQEQDDTLMWTHRDDRQYIMDRIYDDLEFATSNVLATSKFHTTARVSVDKYVVLAWASRICLYEGTYRKYHKVNHATNEEWKEGYTDSKGNFIRYKDSKDFLEAAARYAKAVIESGEYSLHPDFRELFTSETLCSEEVIWGRSYSKSLGVTHSYTQIFNSATMGQQYSGTKELVRHFLNADGTPADPNQSFKDEFKNRDARLAATLVGPDFKVKGYASAVPNFLFCMTGYQISKFFIPEASNITAGKDNNSLPVLRYAEVLLNYAEACEELGKMSKGIWDQTVGALRERAGVVSHYPGDAGYTADPWLRDYYTKNVNIANEDGSSFNLSDVNLEIRRDRVCELTYENELRGDDLYRWRMMDLAVRRHSNASQSWSGIWISEDEYKNGFEINGHKYRINEDVLGTTETTYKISSPTKGNWTLEKSGNGYLLLYNYPLAWDDSYMYTRPIPQSAININKEVGQNYGWEDKI